MTAADQGQGKNLQAEREGGAPSAGLHLVERRIVHLVMLTVSASAAKEVLAIIGTLLSVSSSRQATVLRVRNTVSYTHPRKALQLQRRSSRRLLAAVRMGTRMRKLRKLRLRRSLRIRLRCFSASRRLPAPASQPSSPRRYTSPSSRRRSLREAADLHQMGHQDS